MDWVVQYMPWIGVVEDIQYPRVVWYWIGEVEDVQCPKDETSQVIWYMPWTGVAEDVHCSKVETCWVVWYMCWKGVAKGVVEDVPRDVY